MKERKMYPVDWSCPYALSASRETELNTIVSDIFNGEIADIIEVTYAYARVEDLFINKSLFFDLHKITFDGEKYLNKEYNLRELYTMTENFLRHKESRINDWIGLLDSKAILSSEAQIIRGSLINAKKILQVTLLGLPFEGEKAGIGHQLNWEEVDRRVDVMQKIEADVFGWNVSDSLIESARCIASLKESLSTAKKKNRLTPEEMDRMLRYIQEIESSSTQSKPEETQQYFEKKKIPAEKLGKNIEKYLNTPIKRDKYTAIFKSVFELYGLDIPIIHEERSSIYDSENALRIPTSPEYNSISLQRILALIQHEIECHYINLKNSRKAIGNVRGKDNLEKEEGIATVSEYLLEGYKIEQLDFVVGSLPSILAGELLQGDDFEDFTRLMRIMEGEGRDSSPHSLFLRRKRNYPLEQRGVQHKDTSYTRGLFKTIEYIAEWKDIRNIFLGKVGFSDLPLMRGIFESTQQEITFPFLVGEMLLYSLWNSEVREQEFSEYIHEKYPFLKKEQSYKLVFNQKRKIIEILESIWLGERQEARQERKKKRF